MVRHDDERREFVRVPFNTRVEVSAHDWLVRTDRDIDVSMNGLRLSGIDHKGSHPLPGTPCKATIHLQALGDRFAIEARGTIIRSEPGNLAVEFVDMDVDSYQHLRRLILSNTDDVETAEHQFDVHRGIRRNA